MAKPPESGGWVSEEAPVVILGRRKETVEYFYVIWIVVLSRYRFPLPWCSCIMHYALGIVKKDTFYSEEFDPGSG